MAERNGKPICPQCNHTGRTRKNLKDGSIVCGDCGYDSRKVEVKKENNDPVQR